MRTEPEWLHLGVIPGPPTNSPLLWGQSALPLRLSVLGLAVFLSLPLIGCGKKDVGAEAAPPDVEVAEVVQQDVPLYTECISTLDGYVNAQIQPQVTGYLMRQNYAEGTVVHAGD